VIAPFLRGYAPTETKSGPFYDRATLAQDIAQLIEKINDGQPAFLVGQDWGAAVIYGVLGAFPEKVRRAMLLAVPHPVEINRTLKRSPKHIIRSFIGFYFSCLGYQSLLFVVQKGIFYVFFGNYGHQTLTMKNT
jgi:pimeloyl-ACP methyl ester carboxylesterase